MEALAFLTWVAVAFLIGMLWSRSVMRQRSPRARFVLGMLTCPSCREYFTPEKRTAECQCQNGLVYCAKCKREGKCGC